MAQIDIQVCDFCFSQHKKYSKFSQIFDTKNKLVQNSCTMCNKGMCQKCIDNSLEITSTTEAQDFGIVLCAECIEKYRYGENLKPRLDFEIARAKEIAKQLVRQSILTQIQKNENIRNYDRLFELQNKK